MFRSTINFLSGMLLLCMPLSAAASQFGYCTDAINRNNTFRLGATEKQGLAIKISKEKLQLLKGQTINTISASFGSSRTSDGTAEIFITADLNKEPLVKQNSKISSAVKWIDFTLDTPYTITGSEDALYLGYTASIGTTSKLLMSDFTADIANKAYAYCDGEWIDTYGLGCGVPSIRFGVSADEAFTDLTIKPVAIEGYFKADINYSLEGQLMNFGPQTVNAFDLSVRVGSNDIVVTPYSGLNIKQGEVFDFKLPQIISNEPGTEEVSIEIVNVNGVTDIDKSDNIFSTDMFFYPASMERSILLEGFTGQECSNCPSGHSIIHKFLETATTIPVIEVMHHAGYNPDFFTMKSDGDYTFFYGSTSTFAPAVMLNRSHVSTIGTCPVMNVSTNNLQAAYTALESRQPYVSLGLESDFNPATREVTVKVRSYAHTDLPSADNVINVMLIQDSIVSMQVPYGATYTHNAVFRGALTGNSWGLMLLPESCVAGGVAEWSTTFTLPESIFSDYWNYDKLSEIEKIAYSIVTVPENMHLVAYVGAYSQNDFNAQPVYNAVSVPLGKSYTQGGITSITDIETDEIQPININVVNGFIIVDGVYDNVNVYTITGHQIAPGQQLDKGVYIICVTSGTKSVVKKVLVK